MANYTILRHGDGKYTVEIEIDEDNGTPIVSGPYDTEVAASAYVDEHRRAAADGERRTRTTRGDRD